MDPTTQAGTMELEERRRYRLDDLCAAYGKSRRTVQALPPVFASESLHDKADRPSPYWEPVPVCLSLLRRGRGSATSVI